MAEKIIINAESSALGRLASYAAKQALLGKEVIIVNCNKAVVVGDEKEIIERYKIKRRRGGSGLQGPNISAVPEKIVKRTIRGMLAYTQGRGRDALKRIRCYNEMLEEHKNKEMVKMKSKDGMSIKRLCEMLGGKR